LSRKGFLAHDRIRVGPLLTHRAPRLARAIRDVTDRPHPPATPARGGELLGERVDLRARPDRAPLV
jgi:hypothetical protein